LSHVGLGKEQIEHKKERIPMLGSNSVLRYHFCMMAVPLLLTGCSAKGTITGKVSYRGQTLNSGIVTFFPEDGGGAFPAGIAADGTYRIEQVPIGKMKVAIQSTPNSLQ
jgi:hypothetical protein